MIEEKNTEPYILEDDEDHRDWIEAALKKAGIWPYSMFANSNDLLGKFTRDHYLLVLDLRLSENRDGAEVVKEVRDINPDAYIIIISGQNEPKVFIQLIKIKANDYVDKNNKGWLDELVISIKSGREDVIKKLNEKEQKAQLIQELQAIRDDISERRKKRTNDTGPNN